MENLGCEAHSNRLGISFAPLSGSRIECIGNTLLGTCTLESGFPFIFICLLYLMLRKLMIPK